MTFGCPAELLCCFSGFFSNSAWIPSSRIKKKEKRHNGAKGSVFKVPSHAHHARKLNNNGFI